MKYKVGTLRIGNDAYANFLWQQTDAKVQTLQVIGHDDDGNEIFSQNVDPVLVISAEAIVPRGTALPVPGAVVTLEGIAVPTYNVDGSVASGSLQILDPDASGSGETGLDFEVGGEPTILMRNREVTKIQVEFRRPLVNGVNAADASSSASSSAP